MHDYYLQYVTTSSAQPHLLEQHIVYTTGADKRVSWPSKRADYKHEYVQPPAAHSREHQKWAVANPVHQYRYKVTFHVSCRSLLWRTLLPPVLMILTTIS